MQLLPHSIFWEVFYRCELTRAELAASLSTSLPTVSRGVEALTAKGLLQESSPVASKRGRPPVLLRVNPEFARFAGIEIDRDRIVAVVTNMGARVLGRGSVSRNPGASPERLARDCASALHTAAKEADIQPNKVAGAGIGSVAWARLGEIRKLALHKALEELLRIPVAMDDRSRAAALAQHILFPKHAAHRNALYIYCGSGIGAGIFLNGRLFRGATAAAGELGHIVIDRDGPFCNCGKRGCVEMYASAAAIGARAAALRKAGRASSIQTEVANARRGDPSARQALREAAFALGKAITVAIQVLNPSLVVLSGSVADSAPDLLREAIQQTILSESLPSISGGIEIVFAPAGKDAAARGCALLAASAFGPALLERSLPPN